MPQSLSYKKKSDEWSSNSYNKSVLYDILSMIQKGEKIKIKSFVPYGMYFQTKKTHNKRPYEVNIWDTITN